MIALPAHKRFGVVINAQKNTMGTNIYDRISKAFSIPSLADLIVEKFQTQLE